MLELNSCSKKGGIIIEFKNKNILLNKGLILVPMAILSVTIFGNISYASNSITDTKDRIKEIKIVEETNVDKLIRNKEIKIVNNYTRNIKTTSRNEAQRKSKKEETKKEQKYIKPKDVKISKNKRLY